MRLPVQPISCMLGARSVQLNSRKQIAGTGALMAKDSLSKTNWKKDVVYLYQFPRSPVVPNLSPFCLKVETYLRVHNIKHEVTGNFYHRSQAGLLPFIELNGKQYADSQVILWTLQKHFAVQEGPFTEEQRAVIRTVERMVDSATFFPLQWDKAVTNAPSLLSRSISGAPLPGFITNMLAKKFSEQARRRINREMGKLSKDEREEVLRRDIEAIDAILGEKKFLFGDTMTTADCSVFGQLGVTFFLPYRQSITDLLEDDFPRVRRYLERIRSHYFNEWKQQ